MARWLCAYPIGVFYDGYVKGHMRHHAGTNTETDPAADTEKYRITDFRDPKLYLLLLKDISGLTAFEIFFAYKQTEEGGQQDTSRIKTLACLSVCQLVVMGVLFQYHVLHYILLWIIPAISPHMFLMRIRGIAEHGLSKQLGVAVTQGWQGNFYTRSFGTEQKHYRFAPFVWLERLLIGSLSVYHHHEHHLLPTVPFYHLGTVHRKIGARVAELNPDVYASGYVAAALKNILEAPVPSLHEAVTHV
jgi:fatty acid desaturase